MYMYACEICAFVARYTVILYTVYFTIKDFTLDFYNFFNRRQFQLQIVTNNFLTNIITSRDVHTVI